MKEWNVKIVKFPIHPASYFWYEKHRPGVFLKSLNQGIEWDARNGIYSVVDFHSCGWPSPEEYFGGKYDPNWECNIYEFAPEGIERFLENGFKVFYNGY